MGACCFEKKDKKLGKANYWKQPINVTSDQRYSPADRFPLQPLPAKRQNCRRQPVGNLSTLFSGVVRVKGGSVSQGEMHSAIQHAKARPPGTLKRAPHSSIIQGDSSTLGKPPGNSTGGSCDAVAMAFRCSYNWWYTDLGTLPVERCGDVIENAELSVLLGLAEQRGKTGLRRTELPRKPPLSQLSAAEQHLSLFPLLCRTVSHYSPLVFRSCSQPAFQALKRGGGLPRTLLCRPPPSLRPAAEMERERQPSADKESTLLSVLGSLLTR
ncbi:hypothetical protein JZ751_024932 [Albula glossodonta]|uniref:Uncharacterized protein n=1 Tax=Albula glossodonta TaxID=121402 RepID=A0A8T2PLV2_9TELE|nr:hypothetical protein JZ751_024932 [Albula glossodonta]